MKHRILSLLLTIVMCAGLLTAPASAAVTVTEPIPCQYGWVGDFHDGLAAVMDGNEQWGFIDKAGNMAIPCQYHYDDGEEGEDAPRFCEGLARVSVDTWQWDSYGNPIYKWGFIDKTGHAAVPCVYNYAYDFCGGLARVCVDTKQTDPYGNPIYKWGFVDKAGNEVIPCQYAKVGDFNDGFAPVMNDYDMWGFIDKQGNELAPCKYSGVYNAREGLVSVTTEDGQWAVIDKTGKEIVPPGKYEVVREFVDGMAPMMNNYEKWGFVNGAGQEVVPCIYDEVDFFSDGLAAVRNGNGWGYVDKTGKEVIPCQYLYASFFSEGLAVVEKPMHIYNGKGYIDKTGAEVVPCEYDKARTFQDGLAIVVGASGYYSCFDRTGKEVAFLEYSHLGEFSEGFAVVTDENGKSGFIDNTGREVVTCIYDNARDFSEGYAAVVRNGWWGFISAEITGTAYASTQTVQVDGKAVTFHAYALKDQSGNDTNYIKLRDVAQILNGSAAQFQVGWDGSITITTKTAYTPNGSEMVQNFTGNQSYTVSTSPVTVNGQPTNLEAITLTDASGGGYTYFKLRDLGAALGFNVSWSADTGISIDSNSPYSAAD